MASDPRQIITAICPDLAASPSLDYFLGTAADFFDRGCFGKLYPTLIAWAACHFFTISGGGGSSAIGMGEIASMSEGALSLTFATSGGGTSNGAAFWNTTKFGKMVLGLIKSRLAMGVNMAGLPTYGGLR